MDKGGYTYILTDRPFGVLYTGVTADMAERLTAHREGRGSKFA
jgi:putative endonuclease